MNVENSKDMELLNKIMLIIEANLYKPDFDIIFFSNDLNLSRSTMFKKIKELTGHTAHDFITKIRMQKAAELLLKYPSNIKETAFKLGFTEPYKFYSNF